MTYLPHHRWVAQKNLGRDLLPGEIVHHINGDHYDDRPENLEVLPSPVEHAHRHRRVVDSLLAARCLAARIAEGRSREYVSRLLDPPVAAKTLERWEKGITAIPPWRLPQLAELCCVPVEVLENGVAA